MTDSPNKPLLPVMVTSYEGVYTNVHTDQFASGALNVDGLL